MKTIALIPVRNEELVLPSALKCLEGFCDHIIVADQGSSDDTREIARRHPLVTLVANDLPVGQGFQRRREILFEAFRSFEGKNLALCLDADELVSPVIFQRFCETVRDNCRPGDVLSLHWVQLWRDFHRYRDDQSVWSNSWKPLAFWDDREMEYPSGHFLHEARVPVGRRAPVKMAGFPVLHLQWAYWDRTQYKQAWYRALEFVEAGFSGAEGINARYAITLPAADERTSELPREWSQGVNFPAGAFAPLPNWHRDEMFGFFDRHGLLAFEPLQIWQIAEFKKRFIDEVGRVPIPALVGSAQRGRLRRLARAVVPRPLRSMILGMFH